MLGCIPPAEAPRGGVFPSPGDTEVSGGTGTDPQQLGSSGSCFLLQSGPAPWEGFMERDTSQGSSSGSAGSFSGGPFSSTALSPVRWV